MRAARDPSSPTKTTPALDASVWKVTAVAMLGALLAQMDATVVNVSLPSLAADLHAPLSVIQWVTSGYLLALALALPLSGWLVERVGAKALYLGCFVLFTASSALCGLAWSAGSLIGLRLLQGVSGGLLAPMAQMMIRRVAGRHFTRVAGYAALPVLLGPVLGPVIAGAVLQYANWRWLFLVNVPLGVLAWVLAWRFLPGDAAQGERKPLDGWGLALLSLGLVLVLFGLERITAPLGLPATAAGALLVVAFVWVQQRKGHRALIDLSLFQRRAFSVASLAQFFSNGVVFAGQMLVPVFLINACGLSTGAAGWMMASMGLGMMVSMPLLGMLTERLGERPVAITGAVLSLMSTLMLVERAAHGFDAGLVAVILFARGMGLGAVGLPAMSLAYASLGKGSLAMATTALNIVQRIGGAFLTTLCALFLAGAEQHHTTTIGLNTWAEAFLLLAVLHAVLVLATVMLPHARLHERG